MTSKEKAIEVLNCEYQCYGEGSSLEDILIHDGDDAIIEIKAINLWNAIQELKKPTLDDAIKVVEEMKNNPNNNFMTMKQVLTALKGLKGE